MVTGSLNQSKNSTSLIKYLILAVNIAKDKKEHTPAKDLLLNLGSPHTP